MSRTRTIERAIGKWRGILTALGLDPRQLRDCHGPCPLCGGRDRFRFDDKDGTGSYYCSNCGPGYGIHLAMKFTGLSMPEVSSKIDQLLLTLPEDGVVEKSKRDPKPGLKAVGRQARLPGADDPVMRYLSRRGLAPAAATRFLRQRTYWQGGIRRGDYPCMAHLVVDMNNRPATWHLTYLTAEGEQAPVAAPKKIMPPSRSWKGGAVRLMEHGPVLGIAEGIETAMAAHRLFDIPVWSSLNANNLEWFMPPHGVNHVVIFADNDESYTGQAAAYTLAKRLRMGKTVRHVEVRVPEKAGEDWADVWSANQRERASQ